MRTPFFLEEEICFEDNFFFQNNKKKHFCVELKLFKILRLQLLKVKNYNPQKNVGQFYDGH